MPPYCDVAAHGNEHEKYQHHETDLQIAVLCQCISAWIDSVKPGAMMFHISWTNVPAFSDDSKSQYVMTLTSE